MKHHSVLFLILVFTLYGCLNYESQTGCKPKCKDRECGADGCGGSCGECENYDQCEEGICAPLPCCEDAPAGEYHISVSGTVIDIITGRPANASVAALSPLDALVDPNPIHLYEANTDQNGGFRTDCFDVTEVALGIVFLVDDIGFDGIPGTYFPAGTGVKSWDNNSEKRCVYDAVVYAVPNTMVAFLDAATSVDSARYGFVAGLVINASGNRVEGAVIKMGDGTDLVEVIYPDSTFTEFDGTATSTNGIFVMPHTNFATGIIEVTALKDGMTFKIEKAAPKAGFCYVVTIEEDS